MCLLASPAAADNPDDWVTVKIKKGDTLSGLARKHRTTVKELMSVNKLKKSSLLRLGKRLKLRKKKVDKRAARRAEVRAERRRGKGKAAAIPYAPRGWVTHKVVRGDYLWRIADKYDVKIKEIVRLNRMGKKRRLRPGQVLKIKARGIDMLVGGEALPLKGPGYIAVRPKRSYGTPGTVRLLEHVYAEMATRYPNGAPGLIADLSKEGGGPLRPHKSHQRGTDVDVSYYRKDNRRTRGLEVMTEETLDVGKTWDLIKAYLNTGHISAIFMDWHLQKLLYNHLIAMDYDEDLIGRILQYPRAKNERKGVIRHSPGHHHHLHVRFNCKTATAACKVPRVTWIPDPPALKMLAELEKASEADPEAAPVVVEAEPEAEPVVVKPEPIVPEAEPVVAPTKVAGAAPATAPRAAGLTEFERPLHPMQPVAVRGGIETSTSLGRWQAAIAVPIAETAPIGTRGRERCVRMTRFGAND